MYRPGTLQEVREVTETFLQHYNWERPHQGRSCGNVPPRVAFPTLPTLPDLPARVDPDGWLSTFDQQMYLRHVGHDGCVDVDLQTYYISSQLAKRTVLLQVDAAGKRFVVWHGDQMIKTLPIKGLIGEEMALDDFLKHMHREALSQERRSQTSAPWSLRQPPLW